MIKKELVIIFSEAVSSVDPYRATVKRLVELEEEIHSLHGKLNIIGFGKASVRMAQAIEDNLSERLCSSVIITKYKHSIPTLKKTKVIEAGHPIPDVNGLKGTKQIIELAKSTKEDDLNICLVSGGGSALFVCPYGGISLEEKQKVTGLLLNAGVDIFELNTVRKHLSSVKGGRLAEILYPSRTISLILSDVIGDRVDVIASGPTAPDESSYLDTFCVLQKYNLNDKVPTSVIKLIEGGVEGRIPDTPTKESKVFTTVENIIIGSNKTALEKAREKAESLGYTAEIITGSISGEARDAALWLYQEVKRRGARKGSCYISGGETTVNVKGNGLGGRNLEFALAFAIEIEGEKDIFLLSAGTDGTDGPTDAAGAIVNGETVKEAKAIGLSPERFLSENNSYSFFEKVGNLLITGPTGTNVMDIQIVIIRR